MAQSSLMYYCYFRFYVDESEIIAGMDKFCTGWEHMFAVGYNYQEYKCFVDNLGGFEHWVGDMRGYISQTRETGFLDGSPSDAVFDQSLLMGAERTFTNNILILNGYKPDTKFIIRKITAQDAGIAHKVVFKCGDNQKVNHPVMYTLDHAQIEILKQNSVGFVDNSDVDSYDVMVETSINALVGTQYSFTGGTLTDFNLMFNRNKDDYTDIQSTIVNNSWSHLIIDLGADFTNIAVELFNSYGSAGYGYTYLYHAPTPTGAWTLFCTQTANGEKFCSTSGISGRYIKISLRNVGGSSVGYCYIYRLLVS